MLFLHENNFRLRGIWCTLRRLSFAANLPKTRAEEGFPRNVYDRACVKHGSCSLQAKHKVQFKTGSSDSDSSLNLTAPSGGNRAKSTTVNAISAAAWEITSVEV